MTQEVYDEVEINPEPSLVVPETTYLTLVAAIGENLEHQSTSTLGRPRLSALDIKPLHAALCGPLFWDKQVLLYEASSLNSNGTGNSMMSLVAATKANAAVNPIDVKADSDPSITDYGTDADTKPFDPASESKLSHRRHQLQTSSAPPSLAAAFCQLALEADPQDHGVLPLPDDANIPDLLLKP